MTASWAGVAQVWNVRERGLIGAAMHHGTRVMTAAFAPGGQSVLSASIDGTVKVWDAKTGQQKCKPMTHSTRCAYG